MVKIYSRNGFWYGTADEMIDSIEAKVARIEALEAQVAAADALAERARFWAAHPTVEAARDLILEIQEYDAAKKDPTK